MKMILFKLNHWCHMVGCEGGPGDIIDVTKEQAAYLTERKGGEIVAAGDLTPKAENQVTQQRDDPDALLAHVT